LRCECLFQLNDLSLPLYFLLQELQITPLCFLLCFALQALQIKHLQASPAVPVQLFLVVTAVIILNVVPVLAELMDVMLAPTAVAHVLALESNNVIAALTAAVATGLVA
jgi:hypothetical protein